MCDGIFKIVSEFIRCWATTMLRIKTKRAQSTNILQYLGILKTKKKILNDIL
jgi:hypothetical protein